MKIGELKYCRVPVEDNRSFFFDAVHIFWHEQASFHQHPEWELSYIQTGSGTRMLGQKVEGFARGEVVLLPSNMPHCWSFDQYDHDEEGKIRNITICFSETLLNSCLDSFPELAPAIRKVKSFKEAIRFEGVTLELLQHEMSQMQGLDPVRQLLSLLNIFSVIASSDNLKVVGRSEKQNRSTEKMRAIHLYILNHFQQHITLDEVAVYVNMNRSSLCTFFKRNQGLSLVSYLNEFRIESSCQMLRETDVSIAEICYRVGFNDVPYYNRLFRRIKGVSPGVYRQRALTFSSPPSNPC